MGTITRQDIPERVARRTGQAPSDVKQAIQAFLQEAIAGLSEGNRLEFGNFGVSQVVERKPRAA